MPATASTAWSRVASLPGRLRDPRVQSDLLMIVKATAAAVAAWLLAMRVFDLPQPFLAPWSALLTVHATVFRSVSRGAQQVAATVFGVLLSYVLAELIGVDALTLAVALLLALLLARLGFLREEGVTIATTVLFVLTTGYGQQEEMLGDRILATALGIGVGLAVNVVVLPPLHSRSAAQYVDLIDRMLAGVLTLVARSVRHDDDPDVEPWIELTREIDHQLERAWELVLLSRESLRLNPRRRRLFEDEGTLSYEDVLRRLEDGVAEARSISRSIRESEFRVGEWDPAFRARWTDLADTVARDIGAPQWEVSPLLDDLDALARDLSRGDLSGRLWPTYGSVLVSLRNIVRVVDDVASSQPVRP